jgi:hypothetical protein
MGTHTKNILVGGITSPMQATFRIRYRLLGGVRFDRDPVVNDVVEGLV